MNGWIKLHRKFLEWEWYKKSDMVHLFIHLIISANRKPGKWEGINIKKGQLITGRKKLNKETGISEQSIRTCLERMKSTDEIVIKSTNKYSIITICNYDTYQLTEQEINQQSTSNQPATNHKQEYKNKENKENIYKEGGHLSITWDEFNKLAEEYGNEKADQMIDRVLNYGKNSKYKSLYLTANNWLRKDSPKQSKKLAF